METLNYSSEKKKLEKCKICQSSDFDPEGKCRNCGFIDLEKSKGRAAIIESPEQELTPAQSYNITPEELELLEKREEERDKILAEQARQNIRPVETARFEQITKSPEEIEKEEWARKKIEPFKRDVETFIKTYAAFDKITGEGKIDPSDLSREEAIEVLGRLSRDEKEKIIAHIAADIIPFHISILKPEEQAEIKKYADEFTSGATNIIIEEAFKRTYH